MQSHLLASLRRLSDDELVAGVKDLLAAEHVATVGVRRSVTGAQVHVARAARRYPVLLQMLADGSLDLTNARLLVPRLTPDNCLSLLERARGKTKGSRHIPAEVKRKVWLRDLGRCAFVAATGGRCGERAFLEFHHDEPHALGGEATLANLQLRCRSHNAYEARLLFGRGHGGAGSVRERSASYGTVEARPAAERISSRQRSSTTSQRYSAST